MKRSRLLQRQSKLRNGDEPQRRHETVAERAARMRQRAEAQKNLKRIDAAKRGWKKRRAA